MRARAHRVPIGRPLPALAAPLSREGYLDLASTPWASWMRSGGDITSIPMFGCPAVLTGVRGGYDLDYDRFARQA